MKINFKSFAVFILTLFMTTTIVVVAVMATTGGSLIPPPTAFDSNNNPQGTMHTLDDIYQAIPSTTVIWQTDPGLSLCQNAGQTAQGNGCSISNGNLLDPTGTGAPLMGAVEYCNYLEADGSTIAETPQNIWRLPSIGELLQGLSQGFMINTDGGGFQNGGSYWSATNNSQPQYATGQSGGVSSSNSDPSSTYNVRCVRDLALTPDGGSCTSSLQCASNFCLSNHTCGSPLAEGATCAANADCISQACDLSSNTCKPAGWTCITDPTNNSPLCLHTANLTWETNSNPPSKNWADANTYCTSLGSSWRLPTIQELNAGLTDQFKTNPSTVSGFQYGSGYWSSTPNANYSGVARYAYDWSGDVGSYYDYEYYYYRVRCVR